MTVQETDLIAEILRNRVGEIRKMLEPKDVVVDNVERAMINSDSSSCPRFGCSVQRASYRGSSAISWRLGFAMRLPSPILFLTDL